MSRYLLVQTTLVGALSIAGFSAASAQTTAGATQPMPMATGKKAMTADGKFAHDAALGGMTEVKLGQLASTNGDAPPVKDFGMKMVDDHTKAGDELTGIATSKGMAPPASLDSTHQKMVDKFSGMKGAAFDKAYWKQMETDHKKTIALFQKESTSGKDADLKAFATKTLPTLKMHLQMVEDAMSGKMAKSG